MLPLHPRVALLTPLLVAVILCSPVLVSPVLAEEAADHSPTVDQALRAEVLGDNPTRDKLLEQAITDNEDNQLARWHAGQVKLADKWVTVDQAVEAARASKAYKQYAGRRARAGLSFADQASLARWCERNGLDGPALAHWTVALRINPKSRAAQEALGVKRVGREWMTADEAEAAAKQQQERAMRHKAFVADAEQLLKNLKSENPERIDTGLDEVAGHTDPLALQMLIPMLAGADLPEEVATRAVKRMLDSTLQIDEPWAIDYAIHLALTSPDESVREHAAGTLHYRTEAEYAPPLLARLRMPKEVSVQVSKDGFGNVVSNYDEFQEGPAYDYKKSYRNTRSTYQRFVSAPIFGTRQRWNPGGCGRPPGFVTELGQIGTAYGDATPESRYRQAQAANNAYDDAAQKQSATSRSNAYQEEINTKVATLLRELTGEDLPSEPRALWDWWQSQWDSNPQLREQDTLSKWLGLVKRLPTGFASGSVVQTRTGPRLIDELQIGDEVLAASPVTGELAFKPILFKRVSDGYPIPEIRLTEGGGLGVAPGQLVWSAGEGWRLPQDLDKASRLHGLAGSFAVDSQSTASAERVFSLVVADFHTLFLGADKMLVHDATESRAIDAALPGWVPVVPLDRAVAATDAK